MEKQLLEIKGYYSMNNRNEFTDLNSWTGHILLKDDLSFEGIVVDAGTNDDRLIAGTLVDYQGISLLKLNSLGYDPCAFYGFSDGEQIIGMFEAITPFGTFSCGKCKILLATSQKDKDFESQLEERLETFKHQMGGFNNHLYSRLVENIQETSDNFLQNLEEGREEIERQENIKIKKLVIKNPNTNN